MLMDFVVWYLPVAAFVLNTLVPCSELPSVQGKRKSYSVGLASPLCLSLTKDLAVFLYTFYSHSLPWPSA